MSTRLALSIIIISFVCSLSMVSANDAPNDISLGALSKLEKKLKASDSAADDIFGFCVSISGDYAIVGARDDDDNGSKSGSAYIYNRVGITWEEQAKLIASDGALDDNFGSAVSISNDYAIVAALNDDDNGTSSGSAYIFKRTGDTWAEQAKLTASDGDVYDFFSQSVSISGDYAIIGANGDDDKGLNSGSAYIFLRTGEAWTEQTKLTASDGTESDSFGRSVSIWGEYAAVGAFKDDSIVVDSGSAYIFKRNGSSWIEQTNLVASDESYQDYFGISVSISGDHVVIGAPGVNDNGSDSGSAYVFLRTGESWTEQTKLTASDSAADDYFGYSTAISGNHLIVGAYHNNVYLNEAYISDSGAAYAFNCVNDSWAEQFKLIASDCDQDDLFGYSVGISNENYIAGAFSNNDNGSNSGSAYIYNYEYGFVPENSPANTLITTITGNDPNGDTLTFSLQSDPSDNFEIIEDLGIWKLQVAAEATLDYEVAPSHEITIRADDGNGGTYDDSFIIFVTNVNDAPSDIDLSNNSIPENSPAGTEVGIITGIDPEGDTITFSLLSDPSGFFEIIDDSDTWKLQVAPGATLDHDVAASHEITIRADDGNGEIYDGVFIIAVTAVNQGPTEINLSALLIENKIIASDGSDNDWFGEVVSISGDYAIVAAYGDDDNGNNSGSAYILKREGNAWVEQIKLTASDGAADDFFGRSISNSGDYAVIGAFKDDDNGVDSGSAYIVKNTADTWSGQGKLTASDGESGDSFGLSVDISGDYAIIGAYKDNDGGIDSGSAYIFIRSDDTWAEQAKLTTSDGAEQDYFGQSVSISGDYAIIGANGDDDNGDDSGAAYIFARTGENWSEVTKVIASDGAANNNFGWSVSLSDDYAIIGANGDDDYGVDSGSAYIFKRNGTAWTEQTKLTASDAAAGDCFGSAVSISGDLIIIGAEGNDDNGSESGSAYIFKRTGDTWIEWNKILASDGSSIDRFGQSVSITDDYALVGAYYDDDNGSQSGSIYFYDLSLVSVPENSPAGTFVSTITGVDPEGNPLSFSLQSDPSGNFEIINDSSTWKLQVAPGATLDYEVAPLHEISIRADDGNGGIFDKIFTVFVTDVYEVISLVADAGVDQEVGAVVLVLESDSVVSDAASVILDGSGSVVDPGRTIISYEWSWTLDGFECIDTGTLVSHETRLPSGVHTITLTVKDNHGATSTDEVIITVLEAIPGDIDNSGTVNLTDFVILRNHFGESR